MTATSSVQSNNETRLNDDQLFETIKEFESFIDQKVSDLIYYYSYQSQFLGTLIRQLRARSSILPYDTKTKLLATIPACAERVFKAKGSEQEILSLAENRLIAVQKRLGERIINLENLNFSVQKRRSLPTEAERGQIFNNTVEREWVVIRSNFAESMINLDAYDWEIIKRVFAEVQFLFSETFKSHVDSLKAKL